MNNVVWDFDKARWAVIALDQTAAAIDQSVDERLRQASAFADWNGTHGDRGRADLEAEVREGRALAQRMRDKARDINRRSAAVAAEQRRREEEERRRREEEERRRREEEERRRA